MLLFVKVLHFLASLLVLPELRFVLFLVEIGPLAPILRVSILLELSFQYIDYTIHKFVS